MHRLAFFGTPPFAATILEDLIRKGAHIVAVVTRPDKPVGRSNKLQPSAVKVVAQNSQLPLYQPLKASSPEFVNILKELNCDLFVVAAYGEIFKENLLAVPRLCCINVHSSLLPKYRGAAPIHRSVMAGDSETGVTIMVMQRALDAGDILGVAKVPIPPDMTTGELTALLAQKGGEELWRVLQAFEKGAPTRLPQNPSLASTAPKITLDEAKVDWSKNAQTLHNLIRGVTPHPGAWCPITFRGQSKRLLIKKARPEPHLRGPPGTILPEKGLVIACGEGALSLLEIQLEGKKSLPIADFLRGISRDDLSFKLK